MGKACNGSECGCGGKEVGRAEIIKLSVGAAIFAVGIILPRVVDVNHYVSMTFFVTSYLILGGEIIIRAVRNIARGQVFDENFLMSAATLGAFAIGEYPEAVTVMLFYQTGEYFQGLAVRRSKKSITDLMDIRPDYANLLNSSGEIVKVDPNSIKINDLIVVKPGEKIPLDGVVIEGESMLNTAALTGESVPRKAMISNEVLSGCINQTGVLTIRVTKTFGESTAAKIIDLVENATAKKAPTEKFITKFSHYYTPIVVSLAILIAVIPPLFVGGAAWADWVRRGLVFLVISCPCALVISIPLSFFGGIGGASKKGVLVKGGNYLEALADLDIVVFDKTGTLTKGVFGVTGVFPAEEAGYSENELLRFAAQAEAFSNHPIALSIISYYFEDGGYPRNAPPKTDNAKTRMLKPLRGQKCVNSTPPGCATFGDFSTLTSALSEYTEIAGYGVNVKSDGKIIFAGNRKLMEINGISCFEPSKNVLGTIIYVAVDNLFIGHIIISDEIKPDSVAAIAALKSRGVRQTVMLTGDNTQTANAVAAELGIDKVYAGLLPHQKVEAVETLDKSKHPKGKLAFVGDGINDAPVLARADVGIAMGALGSDAAIEAADVVLMTDEPSKLAEAIDIARFTKRVVRQNIAFALTAKALFLYLGARGVAGMWEAVFADVGVALLAVFNASRVGRQR